eukprot:TRINITY_DN8247_c0_g1_i1.p1 TRINITY_DN8247_c0_g1~~TRINITY_DN8247_c0_g1_i1.p1  ORF type:complete len:276 (-),score=38.63 TRINITY_DN8247_c0_g1_i1:12-839(-)
MVKDLKNRLISFSIVFPTVIYLLQYHYTKHVLGSVIGIVAADEIQKVTRCGVRSLGSRIENFIVSFSMFMSAAFLGAAALNFALFLAVFVAMLSGMCRHSISENSVKVSAFQELGLDIVGYVYVSYLWSHSLLLLSLPYATKILLYTILITSMGEHGGLFIGSMFGRHKVIPHLSPNKSVEGFAGSIFCTVFSSWLFGVLSSEGLPFTSLDYWILGVMIGIFGIIGDLAESFMKRCYGIKDTGNLLPGWGGALDRVDGLIFTFPLVYYYIYYIAY